MDRDAIKNKALGCLLGGLIGDAMGAPVEGWHYERIIKEKGRVVDFEGAGTDDSAIKMVLCEALIKNGGHVSADSFAESFLAHPEYYDLFFVPVRNMYHKIQDGIELPVNAGYGNMASSSSAMAISPIGVVNACDPRVAASEAYEAAGLIHSGCSSFCRDGASAVAAAVAEAFSPDASAESVLAASQTYLHPKSAETMKGKIARALALAREAGSFEEFRRLYYTKMELYNTICDSRETVPVALALFYLSGGDGARAIEYGANFGRDADTIATMSGAIAGAFSGLNGLKSRWIEKATAENARQGELAEKMVDLIIYRCEEKRSVLAKIELIGQNII